MGPPYEHDRHPSRRNPLYPQIQTFGSLIGMSAMGQKRTLQSKRVGLLDARTVHCFELVVAGG
jgi:hypothetical protein